MESVTQCTALNVSDEKHCEETATSMNGLFCSFHSHQCQGHSYPHKRIMTELIINQVSTVDTKDEMPTSTRYQLPHLNTLQTAKSPYPTKLLQISALGSSVKRFMTICSSNISYWTGSFEHESYITVDSLQ